MKEQFTQDERKSYEKTKEDEVAKEDLRKTFRECYTEKKKCMADAKAVVAAAEAGAKKKGKKMPVVEDPFKAARILALVPDGSILQTEASKMCPPGGHIWNNWKDGAWCAHMPPYPRVSAPLSAYGHQESAMH
eukprot:7608114-Heterocapsa_arctica.AAC.1